MPQEQQQIGVIEERSMVRSAFSMCLKNLRRNVGIAQERLAQECGIDRAYMGQLERGRHSPTLDTLLRLFPPLGVNGSLSSDISRILEQTQ